MLQPGQIQPNVRGGVVRGRLERSTSAVGWALAMTMVMIVGAVAWLGAGASGAVARLQVDPAAQATETREAELAELAALRTQVAEACLEPTPTVAATPVAPAPSGQPVAHDGDWIVVVSSATIRATIEEVTAKGIFIELVINVTNDGSESRAFPYLDLVLKDAQGRAFTIDVAATTWLDAKWGLSLDPGLPVDLRLVFDVAADAGFSFVLESTTDPTFRVEVVLQARG